MPHLVVKKFYKADLPQSMDGFEYRFLAQNCNIVGEQLIAVHTKDSDFFLVVKEADAKVIVKSDKTTRPAATATIHKALLGYAKLANLEVLYSNVPPNSHNPHLKEISYLKSIDYFATSFPTQKEVWIEVGFGSGRHLLYQAQKNPEILFIGIEIHRPSIEQVLKQINIQKLKNILLLDYDARLFLEQVPSNIVGRIFVHFPVPWDKKPHRRVISTQFIKEAQRALKPSGTLELRTDSENYYAYSFETFMSFTKMDLHIKKNQDIEVTSKYEARWKRMEKNIYDLIMTNHQKSDPLVIEGSFDFEPIMIEKAKLMALHGTKMIDKEYGFVHFERLYEVDGSFFVYKISMGSFDRPEHLYIFLKENSIEYFPHKPLRSRANIWAHQTMQRALNG